MSAFVDGELSDDVRAAIAAHVDQCDDCRGLVRDLERLRAAARALGPLTPPDHIWLEVAGQIHLQAPHAAPPPPPVARRRPALRQYVAIAAALLLVTAGLYVVSRFESADTRGPVASVETQPSVESAADELTQALEHYDNAIRELEALADDPNSPIDPAITATLSQNMSIVDQAIADSRAALTSDPENEPARASLIDALKEKVSVLQTTVALMNEMSKGDQDAAARVGGSGTGRKS